MRPGPGSAPVIQRRRAPRLDVFGQLEGWLVARRQRVVVLDISTGGLGIAVRDRLEVGSVHALRLNGPQGDAVEIEARVANVRQAASPTGTPHFVVGIELVRESEALNRVIDDLTSALSFDIGTD